VFSTADTIVAVATAAGRGGIGLVRLSGPDAPRIACALLGRRAPLRPRYATFGRIADPEAPTRVLDEVIATWFPAPRSYTMEDVVELGGHGSPVLLERIVSLAIRAGARLAEPGEFTLRAYVHGRLDLVQAEAVADLVDAVTPLQARAAMDQLNGGLTSTLAGIEAALFDLAAKLEASLDFPDEGFHFITPLEARQVLAEVRGGLTRLKGAGRAGRILREGSLVAIVGRPNAGKSSLFNALVGASRAIVTPVPGTTRDLLTERVDVGGVPVTFVDTAGLRSTTDPVEVEGVARSHEVQAIASLSLLVVDGSAEADAEPSGQEARTKTVLVISKCDLPRRATPAGWPTWTGPIAEVSALTGDGLERLRGIILGELTDRDDWRDPPEISNVRHLTQVDRALAALDRVDEALMAGSTEELVLAELAAVRAELEQVTGHRTPEDLLRQIFSRFCIGK
jgi:tRNA modification GTPase